MGFLNFAPILCLELFVADFGPKTQNQIGIAILAHMARKNL